MKSSAFSGGTLQLKLGVSEPKTFLAPSILWFELRSVRLLLCVSLKLHYIEPLISYVLSAMVLESKVGV